MLYWSYKIIFLLNYALFYFNGSTSEASMPCSAIPSGKVIEVTKFNVAQVSIWSKFPCSREKIIPKNVSACTKTPH